MGIELLKVGHPSLSIVSIKQRILIVFTAVFLLALELLNHFRISSINYAQLSLILAFVLFLGFAALIPLFGELLYIALYLSFLLSPLSDELAFSSLGIYVILVLWVIRHWTWPAVGAIAVLSLVSIFSSLAPSSKVLTEVLSWSIVLIFAVAVRLLNDQIVKSRALLEKNKDEVKNAYQKVRSDLAAQLHDTVAKDLARVAITAETIAAAHPEMARELESLTQLAHVASQRIRPMILDLDTGVDRADVGDAISSCRTMLRGRSLTLVVDSNLSKMLPLDPQASKLSSLFIRETATNALKYADPETEIYLTLIVEQHTVSLAMTNQVGSQRIPSGLTGGFGLANLKDRIKAAGGSMSFKKRGNNWTIVAQIPNPSGVNHE